jgi:hypothetical protein
VEVMKREEEILLILDKATEELMKLTIVLLKVQEMVISYNQKIVQSMELKIKMTVLTLEILFQRLLRKKRREIKEL